MKKAIVVAAVLAAWGVLLSGCVGPGAFNTRAHKPVTEAELGVPVYPGATVMLSGRFGEVQHGKDDRDHALMVEEGYDKVYAFYRSRLKNVQSVYRTTSRRGSKSAAFMVRAGKGQIMVLIDTSPSGRCTTITVTRIGEWVFEGNRGWVCLSPMASEKRRAASSSR